MLKVKISIKEEIMEEARHKETSVMSLKHRKSRGQDLGRDPCTSRSARGSRKV